MTTSVLGRPHDFTTPEGLRALVAELIACPGGWDAHPQCGDLLAFVAARFAELCYKYDRPPHDAQAAAFRAMIQPSFLTARDPLGVLTTAVVCEIRAEARAERMLISTEKARRPGEIGEVDVRRAGEEPWLLDSGHQPARSGSDGGVWDGWVVATARFLICCEWPAPLAQSVAELVLARAADYPTWPQARDRVRDDAALAARLGLNRKRWRGLIQVLFGTEPSASFSQLGVVRALAFGVELSDLLADGPICTRAARLSPLAPQNRSEQKGGAR